MASELFPSKRFIYSALSGATGLAVYQDAGPETATRPFVTFTIDAQPHLTTMNKRRVMTPLEFTALVRGEGSSVPLESYVAAIDDSLAWRINQEPEAGWFISHVSEIMPVELPVNYLSGRPIYSMGASYSLVIQPFVGAAVI